LLATFLIFDTLSANPLSFDAIKNSIFNPISSLTSLVSLDTDNQSEGVPNAIIRFVIEITKGEHLDSNRNFISDITEQIKYFDGVWTDTINDGEYARVTFEIPLDSTRDITIFPRIISGNPRVEVYEKAGGHPLSITPEEKTRSGKSLLQNPDKKIAEFTSLTSNEYNKVFLDGSSGTGLPDGYSQDTFDLKVIGGDLQFEHIVDPQNITNFTATGTYTVPTGVTLITVRTWGGGGGGGGSSANKLGGSGGGGGQYAESNISVIEGQVFDVTIGAGGAGGAAGSNPGDSGGNTTFSNATQTYVQAIGGGGGAADEGGGGSGSLDGSIGDIKFYGGLGGTDVNTGGGGGGGAGTTQNGSDASGTTGGTGGSLFGGAGGDGATDVDGNTGFTFRGAGGGGEKVGGTNKAGGAGAQGFAQVIFEEVDLESPQFFTLTETPSDPATYSFGQTYEFNSTWTDNVAVDKVIIEFDGANTTVSEFGSGVYRFTISDLSVGTYNYYWWANDTTGNSNATSTQTYTVSQASPQLNLEITNATYPNNGTINASETNSGDSDLTYRLFIDGVEETTGSMINIFKHLSAGTYNITYNTTGGTNYTAGTNTTLLTIFKGTPTGTITLDPSATETYPTETTATGSESNQGDSDVTYTLYRDDVPVSNPETATLAAGSYTYKFNSTEGENWTAVASLDSQVLTINKGTSVVNTFVNNTRANITIAQDSEIFLNVTQITGDTGATLQLYNNGTLINQGVSPLSNLTLFDTPGIFNISGFYVESENYTGSFEQWNVTVQAPDTAPQWSNPLVDDSTPNPNQAVIHNVTWTDDNALSYATLEINSSGVNCDTTANVSLTTLSGSPDTADLSWIVENFCEGRVIGWRQWANDSINQWNVTSLQTYTVNNVNPLASFGTNPVDNFNSSSNSVTFELKGSDNLDVDFLRLYGDWSGSWIANQTNSSPINDTIWTVTVDGIPEGQHLWAVWVNDTSISGNENFTDTNRTLTVDLTVPSVTRNSPLNQSYTTNSILFNVTATDALTGINTCEYSLNGAANVSLTRDGATNFYNNTNSSMTQGSHTVIYYCDDFAGNLNGTESVIFFIDSINPLIEFVAPTKANDTSANQQWLFANVTITETNFQNVTFKLYNSTGLLNETTFTDSTRSINWTNLLNDNVQYWYNVSTYDVVGNFNETETRYLTLTADQPPTVTILFPENITYNVDVTQLNYTVTDDNGVSTCWYSLDGGVINSSFDATCANATGLTSIQGSNNWTVYANDSINQLGFDVVFFFKDTINPSITNIVEDPVSGATYSFGTTYQFNATITDTNLDVVIISFDGTNYTPTQTGDVFNLTFGDLSAGSYDYYWYANDSAGNVNTSVQSYTVNQNSGACDVLFNETSPITYPQAFRVWSNCNSAFTLYRNGTSINNNSQQNLSTGTYNFTVIRTDQQNYSNVYDEEFFTINKADGDVTLLINGTADNQTAVYGTQTNASASTSFGSVTLLRNGTDVTSENNVFVTLGVDFYNYTAVSSGDENHTGASTTLFVTITQAQSEVNLTLNGTRGNITITQDSTIPINLSTISGDAGANLKLFRDGTLINEGTSPLGNQTTFNSVEVFNITGIYFDSQNFTGSFETWFVNVTDNSQILLNLPLLRQLTRKIRNMNLI
jgi:hypothetical protein